MIVITGGAGFIGSNLAASFEAAGLGPIAVCDRLDDPHKELNIAKRSLAALIAPEDLLAWLADHAREVESVIHMGAISSTTETDEALLKAVNVDLPLALWRWCADVGARLIYASSAATYGDGTGGFDDDPSLAALEALRPLNAYGRSKARFDIEARRLVAAGGPCPPQWVGLKFFNVYGPNEYHKGAMRSVAHQIFPLAKAGRPCRLFKSHNPDYADGGQLRDFVWVGDCADVCLWLHANPGVCGLFNLGTGTARSFADLAAAVYGALGREPLIEYVPTPEHLRPRYQYFTEARMERLRAAGYGAPFTSLEDGVAAYVNGFLDTPDPYR